MYLQITLLFKIITLLSFFYFLKNVKKKRKKRKKKIDKKIKNCKGKMLYKLKKTSLFLFFLYI